MPAYVWCSWFVIYILKNRFSNASRRNACNIKEKSVNTPKPRDKSVDTATLSILFVFLRRRFSKIFHSRQAYQSDVVRTCMCACVCLYICVCVLVWQARNLNRVCKPGKAERQQHSKAATSTSQRNNKKYSGHLPTTVKRVRSFLSVSAACSPPF